MQEVAPAVLAAEQAPPPSLTRRTTLEVTAPIDTATVYLDGLRRGVTPLVVAVPAPSDVTVEVAQPGYVTWKQIISLDADERRIVEAEMVPDAERLFLYNLPEDAEVWVDTQRVALNLEINPDGSYQMWTPAPLGRPRIAVRSGDHTLVRQRVRMRSGEATHIRLNKRVFTLYPVLQSVVVPGAGQLQRGATLKGGVFMAAALGVGAFAVTRHLNYRNEESLYADLRTVYHDQTIEADVVRAREAMLAQHETLKSIHNQRMLGLGVYLGLHSLNILDALLFHSNTSKLVPVPQPPNVEVHASVRPSRHGMQFGMQITF